MMGYTSPDELALFLKDKKNNSRHPPPKISDERGNIGFKARR